MDDIFFGLLTTSRATTISTVGGGSASFISSVKGQSTNTNGFTTSSIDTTGATFLIAWVAYTNSLDSISDSKGNTWTPLTEVIYGFAKGRFYYVANPTSVGTSHTFTVAGTSCYPSIQVVAFNGISISSPFDQQNTNTGANWTTITPGSITPTQANTVVFSGVTIEQPTASVSISDSYTIAEKSDGFTAVAYGGAIAYKVIVSTTPQNPTWTSTVSNGDGVAAIANFDIS